MGKAQELNQKYLWKFILTSLFGIFMFLIPIRIGDSSNTVVSMISDTLKAAGAPIFPAVVTVILAVSAAMSILDFCFNAFENKPQLHQKFAVKPYELVTKILGAVIAFMLLFGIGPKAVLNENTGVMMMGFGATLVSIAVSLSYILPFLTNTGIMEFIGVLAKPVVKPLFKVPGCASLDLITSWFGAANAAVIVTRKKYQMGYYTKQETAIIMTNFSLVSVPFCMVIAGILRLESYFPVFYMLICGIGIILAVILPRIYPICSIPKSYCQGEMNVIDEETPKGKSKLLWAFQQGSEAAREFNGRKIITMGTDVLMGILLNLLPTVIAWGTLALILVEYTPLFQWISWPIGWCLNLAGVEEAFAAAPATLVGFVDMFIPTLLVSAVESVKTRFIIGALSLIQIIYLTEVGAVILQSEVDVNLPKLALIFLERTVIALPIIILVADILF